MAAGNFNRDERAPLSFPDWKEALERAELAAAAREAHRRAILGFLKMCKQRRAPATLVAIREHLAAHPEARVALRWFYRGATAGGVSGVGRVVAPVPAVARAVVPGRGDVPPPGADDLGTEAWERALVKAARERHFLWRTEETYRAWARRFARFIAPRTPDAAGAEEVGAFLSDLAVRQRVAPSTQKQAA